MIPRAVGTALVLGPSCALPPLLGAEFHRRGDVRSIGPTRSGGVHFAVRFTRPSPSGAALPLWGWSARSVGTIPPSLCAPGRPQPGLRRPFVRRLSQPRRGDPVRGRGSARSTTGAGIPRSGAATFGGRSRGSFGATRRAFHAADQRRSVRAMAAPVASQALASRFSVTRPSAQPPWARQASWARRSAFGPHAPWAQTWSSWPHPWTTTRQRGGSTPRGSSGMA